MDIIDNQSKVYFELQSLFTKLKTHIFHSVSTIDWFLQVLKQYLD